MPDAKTESSVKDQEEKTESAGAPFFNALRASS
jgi:hypothetical protein